MIPALLKVCWWTLKRDRVALALTFVLPLAFFTIFAAVFAGLDSDQPRPVTVTVVAGDQGFAAAVADRLAEEPRLATTRRPPAQLADALDGVRRGETSAVVVLPPDLAPFTATAAVEIHADRSDPMAGGAVPGLVQAALAATAAEGFGASGEVVSVRLVDALGRTGKRPSIAFFAAGLGVMFLMLSAAGRSSILLDARDSGVLSRLLALRLGLPRLLAGHGLFLTALGAFQVGLMFLWAGVAFGLDLFTPRAFTGFLVITLAASAAAAAFGLLLCSLCRSRAQLSGVAVVAVLTLCAVGGNLFPAFLMPEPLQAVGRLTFNHWALTAYQKVFWYERPLTELWPQIGGLVAAAAAFFAAALWAAHRWLRRGGLQP